MLDEFDFREEQAKQPGKFGPVVLNLASLITLLASLCAGGYATQIFLDPQSSLNPFPPAATSIPSATPEPPTPEPTPTFTLEPSPTVDETGGFFQIQSGSPIALDSSIFYPELACNFLGVHGQVFGLDFAPIANLRVRVTGTLNGQAIDTVGLTGTATQYGSGAYYEIRLGEAPVASNNELQIVVEDKAGTSVSTPISFSTFDSCQQNLIQINFSEQP
ncbi:MAG: hypothetical protein ACRDFQ_04370 [Anaerolineales bacterium]